LARMMGVSRQTINRALKGLSEGGMIVVRYADIELVDIPALMAKAGPVNENLLKSIDGMVQMADRVMAQVERRA
ncbi:MAG TPA: helix-turn-helix domain-containing protein, partial [Aquabacterium sp.]|nr:helix-turn-helix domain-containing protein [Aquabacterium sp.]